MPNKNKSKLFLILGGLGLYLLSSGISYAVFKSFSSGSKGSIVSPLSPEEGRSQLDLSAPKTETCPLTGEMFTKTERSIWEKRRPLGVMIENHLDSRPQSGLSKADLVYEAVAEGGITRFLAIYFCRASAGDVTVGPVRSSRTYFIDWVSEYGDYPLYTHVGGANDFGNTGETAVKARALEQISNYGWNLYNDLSAMSAGFPTFWRDYERLGRPVATEHTMYASTDKLWDLAEKRGLTQTDKDGNRWDEEFVSWKFSTEDSQEKGSTTSIDFKFWDNKADYDVRWDYDAERDLYLRVNGGQAHQDLNDNEQLTAKAVIVQLTKETGPVDALKHLLYQTVGSGKALIFQNGQVISGTWEKESRTERTYFYGSDGEEVEFAGGPIWIEIVPSGNKVNY